MATRKHEPEVTGYYEQGFWRHADLWQDFDARAEQRPDKPALVCGDATLTFGEVRQAAAALSARLAREGVKPGEVVGLCGRHSIEAVIAMEDRNQVLCSRSEEFNEGIRAFLEKRKPVYIRR